MAAKPRTTRLLRTRLPSCFAGACYLKPTSIRPRCGRRGTYSAAAVLWCASAPHSWPLSSIPTARTTSPRSARSWHTKPTVRGCRSTSPIPACARRSQWRWRSFDHYDQWLGEVELYLTRTAKAHDVQTFSRLPSVPGIGQMLALVLLYEIQDRARCPRVQDFVPSCRLVKCAKESGGKRLGTSGKKIGTVPLRWAVAEAAVLC